MNVFNATQKSQLSSPVNNSSERPSVKRSERSVEEKEAAFLGRGWVKKDKPQNMSPDEVRTAVKNKMQQKEAKSEARALEKLHSKMNTMEEEVPEMVQKMNNDPSDPATALKLKEILEKGGVNFSSKERNTLKNILADY